jgi:hypothetical protein
MDILKYLTIEIITHYIGDYLNEKIKINDIDINTSIICINNIELDIKKINEIEIIKNCIELLNIKFKKIYIDKIKFNRGEILFSYPNKKYSNNKIEIMYLDGLDIILEANNYLESFYPNLLNNNISNISIDNLNDYAFENIKNNNSNIFGNDDFILNYISNILTNLIFNININIKSIKIKFEIECLPIIIIIPSLILNTSDKKLEKSSQINEAKLYPSKQLIIDKINIYNNNLTINIRGRRFSQSENETFGVGKQSFVSESRPFEFLIIKNLIINLQLIKKELNENDLNISSFIDFNNYNTEIILTCNITNILINLNNNTNFSLEYLLKLINNIKSYSSSDNNSLIDTSKIIQNNKISRIHKKFINKYNLKYKIKCNNIKISVDNILYINIDNIVSLIKTNINSIIDKQNNISYKLLINNINIIIIDEILDKLITFYKNNNNKLSLKSENLTSTKLQLNKYNNNLLNKLLELKIKVKINNLNLKLQNRNKGYIDIIIHNFKINFNNNNIIKLKNKNCYNYKYYFLINDLIIKDGINKSKWNKLLSNDVTMNKYNEDMFIILFNIDNFNDKYILNFYININPLRLFINQYSLFYIISIINKYNNLEKFYSVSKNIKFESQKNSKLNNTYILQSIKSNKILLQIDYKPVRFNIKDLWNSNYYELINIFPIENLNIVLHPIHIGNNNSNIKYNFENVTESNLSNNNWNLCKQKILNDICKNISYKYLTSIILINSLTNIMSSILDIFVIPYDEYKNNKDIYTSLSNGIISCVDKITKNSFDIITKLTINLGSTIEYGENIIYPNKYLQNEKSKFSNQPINIIDGFSQSYNTIMNDFGNIIILPFNNLLELPKIIPIIILKPLSSTLYSISKIMLGLKNNLIINDNIIKEISNKYDK